MKIKELENILSISRSNIRFYEKQGLFFPERKDNNYREYTEQDIEVLKKIIIFRKMGFTVEEIKLIQNNDLPFAEAIANAQRRIEDEIEQLNGSLKLIKQVAQENLSFDEIDIDEHWNTISESEKSGEKFVDICKDFLELELNSFDAMWKYVFFHDFKKANLGKTAKSLIIFLEKWQKYIGFALEKSNIIIRKKEYDLFVLLFSEVVIVLFVISILFL